LCCRNKQALRRKFEEDEEEDQVEDLEFTTVPQWQVWVEGDNERMSEDSNKYGPVSVNNNNNNNNSYCMYVCLLGPY